MSEILFARSPPRQMVLSGQGGLTAKTKRMRTPRPLAFALATAAALPVEAMGQASASYCAQLKELNNYAMSSGRFAPILGQAKEGNYRQTRLALTGWNNCAFYGATTYTCDSGEFGSHEEAAQAQQRIAKEILDCFAGTWQEANEQMGPDFVVLHPKLGPASITLNLDETADNAHIVRFIMFLRR